MGGAGLGRRRGPRSILRDLVTKKEVIESHCVVPSVSGSTIGLSVEGAYKRVAVDADHIGQGRPQDKSEAMAWPESLSVMR